MEKTLVVHGRQPALGRAEIESLYGSDKLRKAGEKASLVDVDPCLFAFDRLGGSLKFCKVLTVLDTTDWGNIEKFLLQVSPGHSERMDAGKMQLGFSVIGLNVNLRELQSGLLSVKKAIRKTGRNVRVIPNKSLELNAAQVLHNKLTGPTGWELVFVRHGKQTIIAQTVKVQDIEAYSRRDRQRPKRDTRVGMLPPKLAQMIINLAIGGLPAESRQSVCDIPPQEPIPPKHYEGVYLLDPFCGTGVILQEALLMGYNVYGSDIDPRMIDYSNTNIDWLYRNHSGLKGSSRFDTADATSHKWRGEFQFIASEAYLGRPFSSQPDKPTIQKIAGDCDTIIAKFLKNVALQTKNGFRICLAVPAWKTEKGFLHLKTLDKLSDLGYNRVKFVHASNQELVYHRPGQIVARELVVLERK